MTAEGSARDAEIISLTDRVNRFTAADRMTLMSWQARSQARFQGVRLAIHKRQHDDPPEVGEFASIYSGDTEWAAWGAARQGRAIRLWRARDGRDIGRFATMGEALAAVTLPEAPPRRR